jgi:hypothetical protein
LLHTWTRELLYHPHLHVVVSGGGLSLDDQRWVASATRHLFPVRVLQRMFRGRFLAEVKAAHADGQLLEVSDVELRRTSRVLYRKT